MEHRKRKRVWCHVFTIATLAIAQLAMAQDVMKVAPDTHKVLLENDEVRVLSVLIKPGEKVPMHSHPANVGYFLGPAKVKLTLPDGTTQEREIKADVASWSGPATHAVENIGATDLREVQIELKRPVGKSAGAESMKMK